MIVTHDRADAAALGGEILVMERGAVVQRGRLSELGTRPDSPFVRRFTGARDDDASAVDDGRSGPPTT